MLPNEYSKKPILKRNGLFLLLVACAPHLKIEDLRYAFPPKAELFAVGGRCTLCFCVARRPVLELARGVAVSTGGAYAPEQLKGEGN